MSRFLVTGGCGFIGSHVVRELLDSTATDAVAVIDNLSSGTLEHLAASADDPRLRVHQHGLEDFDSIAPIFTGVDHVFHFAANPDIARATTEPRIDFDQGTVLTQNVLEAMRSNHVTKLTYASGSGVYGLRSHENPSETFGPLEPISTYGASKLACEALICSYCHMFGLTASAFRFANVVGPRQTHGVVYDFVRRLRSDPTVLHVQGNGSQTKSYIWVSDVIAAMMLASPSDETPFDVFNVGTGDHITVRRIAEIVCEQMGLETTAIEYEEQARGWKGDVPIVQFNDSKIRARGWSNRFSSEQSIRASVASNLQETEGST